tara:strand:- start:1082 stop:2302 length:1221 start_codon:yes stop_codon:yes gene_type:complete
MSKKIKQLRDDFPLLKKNNSKSLIYLDNTATTQKPKQVIDAMKDFLENENATVHRGIYGLSQKATSRCDDIRMSIKDFINAKSENEIIFTKGATESINLVAHSYAYDNLEEGDEVIITEMEHHANIVPWQQVCNAKNANLIVLKISKKGEIDLENFKEKCNSKTKIVAITHISNVLGTINPLDQIIPYIRANTNAVILIDGAQAVGHKPIDLQKMDCDFYVFSAHKMYGPTGIGILYGKYELLEKMRPYQHGGDMIELVSFDKTTFAKPPARFEAGTPAIVEIIGLGASIDYLKQLNLDEINKYEKELLDYATEKLSQIKGLTIIGQSNNKGAIISFTLEGIHPHDIGQFLDEEGIAVRVGHHCAQPLMKIYNVPATVRASFSFYNNKDEIDALVESVKKLKGFFE